MENLILQANLREKTGGASAKQLRKQGLTPAVIYGHDEQKSVSVNYHDFDMLIHTMHSEHAMIKLKLDKDEFDVLVKDVQRDSVTHNIIHIDFLVVSLDEVVKVDVQVEIHGEAEGVKNQGGVLELLKREIQVECQAAKIPDSIVIDVEPLNVHDVVHVKELPPIEGLKYLDDPETVIVTVAPPTVHVETTETEGEEEVVEPEVIGEKKTEE